MRHLIPQEERISQGRDVLRLQALGVSMAVIARRKGTAFNTVKQWAKEAKSRDCS